MKGFIVIGFFVLMSSFVSAGDIEFSLDSINSSIFEDESASYRLRVINHGDADERFQASTRSTKFALLTKPRLETLLIEPDTYEETLLYLNPRSVEVGSYGVPIKIKSLTTGEIFEANLAVYIKDPELPIGVYPPNPTMSMEIPETLDPRESLRVDISLRNRNPRHLEEVTIIIESDIPNVNKRYTTNLNGMEEKGNELLFELDDLQAPGSYKVNVKLLFEDRVYAEDSANIQIKGYTEVDQNKDYEQGFLKSKKTHVFTNSGNSAERVHEKVKSNWFRNIFISTQPGAGDYSDESGTYLSWEFTLGPQESYEIVIVESYQVPVIVIVIIILSIVLYFFLRSPVIIRKEAVSKRKEGVSEIKVKLFVKNRSRLQLSKIAISDRVPAIAEYVQSNAIGTMHPSRVSKSSKKGTVLHFELHSLDPFEERIITYKMKSKLSIIGSVVLKSARIRFQAKGKERSVLSNDVKLRK